METTCTRIGLRTKKLPDANKKNANCFREIYLFSRSIPLAAGMVILSPAYSFW